MSEPEKSEPEKSEPREKARAPRHHCVVREDLELGLKYAMLLHAAAQSAGLGTPHDDSTYAVALEASALEMSEAVMALRNRGFKVSLVVEDEGEFAGHMLAFGVEPTIDNRVRKITYHFRMLGSPSLAR